MPAHNTLHPFAPGDRVVAIDTRVGPRIWNEPGDKNLIHLPDGMLRKGVVYHVEEINFISGSPGVYITGLRCGWIDRKLAWCASRFRKVDALGYHAPKKRVRKVPIPAISVALH